MKKFKQIKQIVKIDAFRGNSGNSGGDGMLNSNHRGTGWGKTAGDLGETVPRVPLGIPRADWAIAHLGFCRIDGAAQDRRCYQAVVAGRITTCPTSYSFR